MNHIINCYSIFKNDRSRLLMITNFYDPYRYFRYFIHEWWSKLILNIFLQNASEKNIVCH